MDIEYEHRLTDVEGKVEAQEKRLNDVEKKQSDLDELVSSVKVLAVREENVEKDVKEIKSDVKTLTGKSGQRWDSIVEKLIWLVVAAVAGFFLAKFGL